MSKKQITIIVLSVLILILLGFIGYNFLESRYRKNLDAALEQEKAAWQEKNTELEGKVDSLKKKISTLSGDADLVEDDESSDIDSEYSDSIEEIESRIASFFVHLDQQDYLIKYQLTGSTYNEYEKVIQELSEKPPLLGNETESLYNMFLNIAHFYRVLGSKRLSLIKDVIDNENENIESTMRDFYLWYTYDGNDRKRIKGRPSQQVLYQYAGFLLNTIGGRNYLMRRDSKTRILASYYSVLILDRANDMKLNSSGIDIRPYLRLVISDLSNKSGLNFHYEYMKNLKRLKEKYNIN